MLTTGRKNMRLAAFRGGCEPVGGEGRVGLDGHDA